MTKDIQNEKKEHSEMIVEFNLLTAKLKNFFERYEETRKKQKINGYAAPDIEGE